MSNKQENVNFISSDILKVALKDTFTKLNPHNQLKNPVMFITWVCALVTSLIAIRNGATGQSSFFEAQIALWLWFTVLFANFSEAIAEGRGKAQADTLKKARSKTLARLMNGKHETVINALSLKKGNIVVCETGDLIPGDGEVIEGIASVDESAITGESAPVIRESGGDRSSVTGGTLVISDRILIRIVSDPGSSFLDRMISLVESASRQKTPNEIALSILLSGLTLVFILAVVTLKFFADYSGKASHQDLSHIITVPVLISLLVCLIPTTIGGLLSAIGISGMDRLIRKNVIATSGRAVEAAGDIDVLLLDKTGTITIGNRMASDFRAGPGISDTLLAKTALLSSLSDETPEGRSIVVLAQNKYLVPEVDLAFAQVEYIPFTAQTRMSGINITENGKVTTIRKGASDSVKDYIETLGGIFPTAIQDIVDGIGRAGGTPLVVCKDKQVQGVIYLKDIVKPGINERFAELRKMGIRTVMITGDNPLTAAAIAAEAGVDDFLAQATPEMKLARIREEQAKGHLVAMTGDGTNDAPALAQADVGVAMNTGTQAAKEAGNMVDLDSNPTKLIEIVETGKQLLMTRGALTTFSVANDIAKYFAILPALFATLYATNNLPGPMASLNIMHLASSQSAILSAVIFNALVIVALIPLALRGVKYKPMPASALLQKNLLIYGVGGIIAPFIGIKLIDVVITTLGWV